MKRYFIVTFIYQADNNSKINTGEGQLSIESDGFINKKEIENNIVKQIKKECNHLKFIIATIQNIIELNEKDYNSWLGINTEQEENWDEIIKNIMFDINYHPKYFITASERLARPANIFFYNLYNKTNQKVFAEEIANNKTLKELKEILKKKYYE